MNGRPAVRRRLGADLISGILVLSAVSVTALVVRREFFAPPPASAIAPVPDRSVTGWEGLMHQGRVLGVSGAQVSIVEFSDFQCIFCEQVRPELLRLRRLDPDAVAVVYRHFVLEEARPDAFAAAMASECAAEQGRFEQFHDALFEAQNEIGVLPLSVFAERAGVPDPREFQECVDEEHFRGRVEEDTRAGAELGVIGTPAFVFQGVLYTGIGAPGRLEPVLRQVLAER